MKKFLNQIKKTLSTTLKSKKEKVDKNLLNIDIPSFSAILPYRYYDEERRFFLNKNSIGVGWEVNTFYGANEALITSLNNFLKYKVDGVELQFLFWCTNKVGGQIEEAFVDQVEMPEMTKGALNYYKKAAVKGFKNKRDYPISLRNYRLFIFVSKAGEFEDNENLLKEVEELCFGIETELETMKFCPARVSLHTFLELVNNLVNPDNNDINYTTPKIDPFEELNEQIVDRSFGMLNGKENLIIEKQSSALSERVETVITNLSLKSLPNNFALWDAADNYFSILRSNQAIYCPFCISFHIKLIPEVEAKKKAQRKFLEMDKKANTIYAKHFSGTIEEAQEWSKVRGDVNSGIVRLGKAFFNLILFSEKGEEKRDESAAISAFRANGWELYNATYLQLQSFLATLPFVISEGMFDDLEMGYRTKTLTTWNLANLLPIVADLKLKGKGMLLSSFRNQICFFDAFNDQFDLSNYNIAVAATSGAGKSFLIQNLLRYTLSQKGKCFVIDLGRSYLKFCEMEQGTYLEYSALRLNPFTNVNDIQEYSEQIRDLFSILASPSGNLDEVQEEFLRLAITQAFKKKGKETKVDDVVNELIESNNDRGNARIGDLIVLLKRYCSDGVYPSIFNDYSALAPEDNLVVLELGELENKPDLLKAVLFALILNIETQMYSSPRNMQKMVVIDEAWRLLSGDNKAAADFIGKGYRTSRRHLGSFVTITQSIEDFQQSEEAKACWSNSATKIIMLQNAKAFEDYLLNHKDSFNGYVAEIIKNFKEAKSNGFSEFMLQLDKVQTFCRLFVDPVSRVMFSSSGREFMQVQRYVEAGFSIEESINKVARENYGDEFD